ncbi:MAG TPA: hypothetical protein VK348_08905, partial [Planctomycetota bacterium]|nr:hypothetical protein [Planctomycetota bacterium]
MIKLQLHPDARMLRQFAWVSLGAFPGIAGLFRWRFDLPMPWVYALCALGVAVFGTELAGIPILARLVFRTLVLITFPIGL